MNVQKNDTDLTVGTELYCHTSCIMSKTRKTTTVGKTYTITHIDRDKRFSIIDDELTVHYFSGKSKDSYYEKWFYSSSKIIRKKKLEKILKING